RQMVHLDTNCAKCFSMQELITSYQSESGSRSGRTPSFPPQGGATMRIGSMKWPLSAAVALVVLAIGPAPAGADPMRYTITALGTLPGTSRSIATGINSQGQVTGVSYSSSDGAWTATGLLQPLGISFDAGAKSFLFSNGQMGEINPTDGPAHALNNNGQVVG